MLLPLGEDIRVEVDVLFPTRVELFAVSGAILRREEDHLVVELAEPVVLEVGTRVLLDAGPEGGLRLRGRVLQATGVCLRVQVSGAVSSDARSSGRTVGGLRVRLSPSLGGDAARRWIEEGFALPAAEAWPEALPDVEFGMTGLWLDVPAGTPLHGKLLLSMQACGDSTWYRATALLRRVEPAGPATGVALEFLDVPEDTADALVRCALAPLL